MTVILTIEEARFAAQAILFIFDCGTKVVHFFCFIVNVIPSPMMKTESPTDDKITNERTGYHYHCPKLQNGTRRIRRIMTIGHRQRRRCHLQSPKNKSRKQCSGKHQGSAPTIIGAATGVIIIGSSRSCWFAPNLEERA